MNDTISFQGAKAKFTHTEAEITHMKVEISPTEAEYTHREAKFTHLKAQFTHSKAQLTLTDPLRFLAFNIIRSFVRLSTEELIFTRLFCCQANRGSNCDKRRGPHWVLLSVSCVRV